MRKRYGVAGAIAAAAIFATTAAATIALISVADHALAAKKNAVSHSAMINRANKGDRQPAVAANNTPRKITTVEVIGVEDAAIIYRDRHGQVLFRTDPVSNVTVVTKGVVLPEVTIRETADSDVQKLPLDGIRPTLSPTSPSTGCEGIVPSHAGPAEIARIPSRCVTNATEAKSNFAALN